MRGSGLGLPLSRRLAELLGGTLAVTSELGIGSTFRLELPLEAGVAAIDRQSTDVRHLVDELSDRAGAGPLVAGQTLRVDGLGG